MNKLKNNKSKALIINKTFLQSHIDSIPLNAFGVFATIRRSKLHKLPNYPEDIHGCIGYWSSDYSIIKPQNFFTHLFDVSNSALTKDNRRTYFPPITRDPEATIEIDFMLLPKYSIDSRSGMISVDSSIGASIGASNNLIPFNNSIYGLIVEGSNNTRATYLPHVFPSNTSWNELKKSLISKAGATNTKNKFYAYKIKQVKMKLF